jgi:hypothetical protein
MEIVRTQEISFIAQPKRKGSQMVAYNVDVNGKPYGKVYTFKARGETHPWHVSELNGFHDTRATKAAAFQLIKDRVATYY